MPVAVTDYGSINKITYPDTNINKESKNKESKNNKGFAEKVFLNYEKILNIKEEERMTDLPQKTKTIDIFEDRSLEALNQHFEKKEKSEKPGQIKYKVIDYYDEPFSGELIAKCDT
ncbi:MAG: hypothetical protein ACRCUS_06455, partial [Anaerovoracaceae bacterium]